MRSSGTVPTGFAAIPEALFIGTMTVFAYVMVGLVMVVVFFFGQADPENR